MVTLHIAKLLENEGFGTIDSDIFWEDMPLNSQGDPIDGVWLVSRGAPLDRFNTTTQAFDVYSRNSNKLTSSEVLEDILEYLREAYEEVCDLPTISPYSSTEYYNVRIRPVSGIENVGTDEQGKVVRVISAEVQYNLNKES